MEKLRLRVVVWSAVYTMGAGVFCVIAPVFGYPLEFPKESLRIVQLILPVFVGFLVASARYFVADARRSVPVEDVQRAKVLSSALFIYFLTFTVLLIAVFASFGLSSSKWASPRQAMGIDDLTMLISVLLSFFTGSAGLIVEYVFRLEASAAVGRRKGGS